MRKRILTAVVGLPLLFAMLYFGGIYLFITCVVLTSIGLWEYAKAVNRRLDCKIRFPFLFILGILILCFMKLDYAMVLPLLAVCFIAVFCTEVFLGKADVYRWMASVVGLVYIPMMFGFLLLFDTVPSGRCYLWMVFVIAFITDTAAYFTGMAIGKTKLAPKISPKKTVTGAVGGVVFSAIAMVIYGLILQYNFNFILPIYMYIVLGVVGSIAGQCGDLTASMLKRKMDIKDFGKCLPGHGGILDRFDSILFIIPIVYIFAIYTFGYL
ncbi:phosphatidate cytidylyltransferase [Eubacterium aggregans]|uniref:phosphatidate cytidylyltransferase n=1 Tax=Eubacterium aggregans TaxID=81409 RepID=UPI003F374EE8